MSTSGVARRHARLLPAFLLALVALGAPVVAAQAATTEPLPLPAGWHLTASHTLGRGAEHFVLTRADGPIAAHVVRAARNSLALQAVVSHDRIAGPSAAGERTSAMCARFGCIAAVNADFARVPTDQPVGAVVSAGRILRSPVGTHHQFSVGWGPLMSIGVLEWNARLVSSDLRELSIAGLNDRNVGTGVVIYTPAWGASLPVGANYTNLVVRLGGGVGELVPATTTPVELVELLTGVEQVALASGSAVLSATSEAGLALQDLWQRANDGTASRHALVRVDLGPDAKDSVGGTPVLVRDGRAWVQNDGTGFVSGRHPRTAVGWDAAGRVLMVTVDGRQPGHSIGMTLPELAGLLVGIGAVEALNLDGGGSTTMVVGNSVVNLPSDRLVRRGGTELLTHLVTPGDQVLGNVERPVSVGLLLIPFEPVGAPATASTTRQDPMEGQLLTLPETRELALALPAGDPGSLPAAGGHAALLVASAPRATSGLTGGWVLVALTLQLVIGAAAARRLT